MENYINDCKYILAATSPEVRTLLGRIKAENLYPPFLDMVVRALEDLVSRGRHFYVTCGERTWDEQHALYLKGRRGIKGEGKVTTVDSGDSAHNYAIAVDGAYDTDNNKSGLQPSWEKPEMKIWADAGCAVGLDAGYYWDNFFDGPHLQLNIRKYGLSPRKQLKAAYLKGGKTAVFKLLDNYEW